MIKTISLWLEENRTKWNKSFKKFESEKNEAEKMKIQKEMDELDVMMWELLNLYKKFLTK